MLSERGKEFEFRTKIKFILGTRPIQIAVRAAQGHTVLALKFVRSHPFCSNQYFLVWYTVNRKNSVKPRKNMVYQPEPKAVRAQVTADCVLFLCVGCVQQNTGCVHPCVLAFFPTRGKFSVVYRLCTAFVLKEHTSCTHPVGCVLYLDVYCTALKTHFIHIGPVQRESCIICFFSWILLLEHATCFKRKLWIVKLYREVAN